jgi:hypothetical protein
MLPAELAAQYLAHAAECFLIAQKLENAVERLSLVNMAHAWMVLAEQAEENSEEKPGAKPH